MFLMGNRIEDVISKSISHIEAMEYRSFDLFDTLTCSWIDKATSKSDLVRRIAIQINSKSPIDLHWLGMRKMIHTKLISDLLWTYSLNYSVKKALPIYTKLTDLKIKGHESVWGLNFPYTSRFINSKANTPNIYNTATTGLAICEFCNLNNSKNEELRTQIESIVYSLFHVFAFTDEGSKGWVTYYPGQKSPTYNVNALTAYFLCKANKTLDKKCANDVVIQKLINLLIEEQNTDGSWYYSRSEIGKWIDGFHTGFIIESLAYVYSHGFESVTLKNTLNKAWNYYITNLFTTEGYPKYYNISNKFPIEAQNCAQAIQTLSLTGLWLGWHKKELLEKVISKSIDDLYNSKGYFFYKKTKYFTYKQSYLRWSTAPMLVALSYANKYLNILPSKKYINDNQKV